MFARLRTRQLPLIVLAVTTIPGIGRAASIVGFGTTLSEYVTNLYTWSVGTGTALAIIFIIYAGYVMITSAGDPGRVGFAKEIIVGTLSGLALLAAASLVFHLLSIQ